MPSGILLTDKPSGPTSHDVVDAVRRVLGIRKVGHAGTLDPMATGLLVVLVGREATRLQSRYMGCDKTYEGRLVLGVVTDTQDAEGQAIATSPVPPFDEDVLRTALRSFVGGIRQVPPAFSAKKHRGKALYRYARAGLEVAVDPRPVTVHRFDLLAFDGTRATFEVECSAGTYIRTLAHDLGQKLGCGAHLDRLRRTRSGNLDVRDALPLDDLAKMAPEALLAHLRPIS